MDLPISFFDEGHTNFFGSIGAWRHYERSALAKRQALLNVLNRLTIWRLMLAVLDGRLVLPKGVTLDALEFAWVPKGMPWWKPSEELRGDLMAAGAGLGDLEAICLARDGGDIKENIRRNGKLLQFARDSGFPLSLVPGQPPIEAPEETQTKTKKD